MEWKLPTRVLVWKFRLKGRKLKSSYLWGFTTCISWGRSCFCCLFLKVLFTQSKRMTWEVRFQVSSIPYLHSLRGSSFRDSRERLGSSENCLSSPYCRCCPSLPPSSGGPSRQRKHNCCDIAMGESPVQHTPDGHWPDRTGYPWNVIAVRSLLTNRPRTQTNKEWGFESKASEHFILKPSQGRFLLWGLFLPMWPGRWRPMRRGDSRLTSKANLDAWTLQGPCVLPCLPGGLTLDAVDWVSGASSPSSLRKLSWPPH